MGKAKTTTVRTTARVVCPKCGVIEIVPAGHAVNCGPCLSDRAKMVGMVPVETGKVAHTPGPWTAHDDDGTGTKPCVLSETVTAYGNFYVAVCNEGTFANARLIAAAPDLLAACKEVDDWLHGCDFEDAPVWDKVKAAIRKATGEIR